MRQIVILLTLLFVTGLFTNPAVAGDFGGSVEKDEMTLEERMEHLGLIIPEEVRQRFAELDRGESPELLNPEDRFDWREMGGVTLVKNQASCGSCWDFAGVGAVESAVLIADGIEWDFSEQQVIDCNTQGYGCNGGWMDAVYLLHRYEGAAQECCYPYRARHGYPCGMDTCLGMIRIQRSRDIWNDVNEIKNALLTGPVSTTFEVKSGFHWNCFRGGPGSPNHAVVIVGWDDDLCDSGGWIVKNSWGPGWGDQGFFHMPYNSCGIGMHTQQPVYPGGLPELVYEPGVVIFYVHSGGQTQRILHLENNGGGDLYYRLKMMKPAFQDEFGYYWFDSNNPLGPDYSWVDISSIGEAVNFNGNPDNGNSGPLDLGFGFSFYGNNFDKVSICSNGWASFTDSTSTSGNNTHIPYGGSPNNLLAPFWTDLDPGAGGEVYYYSNNADSTIISWEGVYDNQQYGTFTFQIQLIAPDTVVYQYKAMEPNGGIEDASIGIENSNGSIGLEVSYDGFFTYGEAGVRFCVADPSGDPDWLEAEVDHGRVRPGYTYDANLTCSAGSLPDGTYFGTIDLYNNDPDTLHMYVPVVMNVGMTAVAEPYAGGIPLRSALWENYPNPFNAQTEIHYILPRSGHVLLEIYNLLGERIGTLVDEHQSGGEHAVSWDASEVASGIYFGKLVTDGEVYTRRMMLVK